MAGTATARSRSSLLRGKCHAICFRTVGNPRRSTGILSAANRRRWRWPWKSEHFECGLRNFSSPQPFNFPTSEGERHEQHRVVGRSSRDRHRGSQPRRLCLSRTHYRTVNTAFSGEHYEQHHLARRRRRDRPRHSLLPRDRLIPEEDAATRINRRPLGSGGFLLFVPIPKEAPRRGGRQRSG